MCSTVSEQSSSSHLQEQFDAPFRSLWLDTSCDGKEELGSVDVGLE